MPAHAADSACKVKAQSDAVAIVVCDEGASMEALRAGGIAACKGRTVCNAWIWTDAGKAPATAPARDADLPKDAAREAKAIWINDSANLATMRKLKN